jgi:hypothetical protein
MAQTGVDITIEELRAQSEAFGQPKNDPGIRAGLPARRYHGGAQLQQCLCVLPDEKARGQTFPFPGRSNGQHHIGFASHSVEKKIAVHVEIEFAQRRDTFSRTGAAEQQIGAESNQPPHRVGLFVQNGLVQLAGSDPSVFCWTERTLF